MPTVSIGPLGLSGGIPGGNGGEVGERDKIKGWTLQSGRGNTQFLRSVIVDDLPPYGLAFTLTVREIPTPGEWKKLRKKLVRALTEQLDCVCWHMVTEWTKEGRPHLHGCAFWPEFVLKASPKIQQTWLRYTRHLGTTNRGQTTRQISCSTGWFIYMAKHASRGLAHYQREQENLPEEWKSSTGRVWSRGGYWPTYREDNELNKDEYYRFRRMLDRYIRSQALTALERARRYGKPNEIQSALRKLKFLNRRRSAFGEGRKASETRGLNEWVPLKVSSRLLRFVVRQQDRTEESAGCEMLLRDHGLTPRDLPF